jgi:galactokinase
MTQPAERPTMADLGARLADIDPVAREDPGSIRVVRAPGRVNLIGEHTDYNDGLVLPVAIDLEIRLALRPVVEPTATVTLAASGETSTIGIAPVGEPRHDWTDYIAGTARELAGAGLGVHGFRGLLASTLPVGAGLSSSAALELAAAWALSGPSGPAAEPLTVAQLAQRAENEYVGVRCGLMDQFASACGVAGSAVLLDCRSLDHRPVPLPADLAIVVADTGAPRSLAASAYNERRADCERAVAAISTVEPRVHSLRDVDVRMLERSRNLLDEVAAARASHVIGENARVLATETALELGDMDELGRLFAASHASLRDLYQVSSQELDTMVEIAVATPGVVASRMTGAGFGGCTVSLVQTGVVDDLRVRIEREYPTRSGRTPRVWVVQAVDGAGPAVDGAGPAD